MNGDEHSLLVSRVLHKADASPSRGLSELLVAPRSKECLELAAFPSKWRIWSCLQPLSRLAITLCSPPWENGMPGFQCSILLGLECLHMRYPNEKAKAVHMCRASQHPLPFRTRA